MASFKECVASGKHQAAVQKDVEEARRLDVSGTPTFVINGRVLTGAQPIEAFVRASLIRKGSALTAILMIDSCTSTRSRLPSASGRLPTG